MHLSNSGTAKRATISIVTATRNAANYLPTLIQSLRRQSDKDFEWVVADGASTDGTLELLKSIADLNIVISSQPDFGIYDALNRAITIASGEYYIVSGADDLFYDDAIANFHRAIDRCAADIIVASAMYDRRRLNVSKGPAWLLGHIAYIAGHTLATAFRKDLHRVFGSYSRKYPIAADQLFVMQACKGGATRYEGNFAAGEIGHCGVSSVDKVGRATETFRVQLDLGRSGVVQALLLMLRLLK